MMNKQLSIIPLCLLAIAYTQFQPQQQPSIAAIPQPVQTIGAGTNVNPTTTPIIAKSNYTGTVKRV